MRTTTLLSPLLLTPFLLLLASTAPIVVAPADVLVPKGATLNARSIPELLALKEANEKRRLKGREMEGGF